MNRNVKNLSILLSKLNLIEKLTIRHASYKQARVLNKLFSGSKNKRKWYNDTMQTASIPTPVYLSKGAHEGRKSVNSKRVAVLNKLFMRNISDLMASQSVSGEFLGHGIELTQVQITPDFKNLNVFWFSKSIKCDQETVEGILKQNAHSLRHELSQLRVMGVVPKITFVKDKFYGNMEEIDVRLAQADYGDEYEPVDKSFHVRNEFLLNRERPEDSEINEEKLITEFKFPTMRHNAFDLDQHKIMNRIKAQIKKSHVKESEPFPTGTIEISDVDQSKTLAKFLQQQQLKKLKVRKIKDRQLRNLDVYPEAVEEFEETVEVHDDNDLDIDDNEMRKL